MMNWRPWTWYQKEQESENTGLCLSRHTQLWPGQWLCGQALPRLSLWGFSGQDHHLSGGLTHTSSLSGRAGRGDRAGRAGRAGVGVTPRSHSSPCRPLVVSLVPCWSAKLCLHALSDRFRGCFQNGKHCAGPQG